jgi:predicted nicotinamide N-methyase
MELKIVQPSNRDSMLQRAQELGEDPPYWAFFWPVAAAYGAFLASHMAGYLAGKLVLEIGAGTGVAGVCTSKAGANVTQIDHQQAAVELMLQTAPLNAVPAGTSLPRPLRLDWHELQDWPVGFDVLIGSEVLYETTAATAICNVLLSPVLKQDGFCLLADPGRPPAERLLQLCKAAGFFAERAAGKAYALVEETIPVHPGSSTVFATGPTPQGFHLLLIGKTQDSAVLDMLRRLLADLGALSASTAHLAPAAAPACVKPPPPPPAPPAPIS